MLEQSRGSAVSDVGGLQAKRVVEATPVLGDLPDLLLVERSRGRDTRAFETLMRRYNRRLFRIGRSILSSADAAEEAVRAAHLRAFANLDRYEPAGKFGAWLARMAFNEALGLRRHQPATQAGTTGTVQIDPASRESLEQAIDALPEVFRTVLVLRVLEELSGVEVAVCLGLNETTVRTRLYRAQQRLKTEVARRLRAEAPSVYELSAERNDHIVAQVFARLNSATPLSEAR